MAEPPLLVFVGGFLGAGKTTLIFHAARLLQKTGRRVAVITNDQDSELVDTKLAQARGIAAGEVAGGCFCCRFSDLMQAAETLRAHQPDVIFAEPVGSCIDLSATILQPIKRLYREDYRLAPLTVLLDPQLARQAVERNLSADLDYLFRNQLAEADLVCTTKVDLYRDPSELPFPVDFALSGETGEGVDTWLAEVLHSSRIAGARLLEVDYTRYAEAEAALAWLNLHARIRLDVPQSPALVCGPLLDCIEQRLRAQSIYIAHLKIFDRCPTGWLKVSLTSDAEPRPEGDLIADPDCHHELALNLRAIAEPSVIRHAVEAALDEIDGDLQIRHLRAFRPPPPHPEFRLTSA